MKAVIFVALCVCVFVSEVACRSYRPRPKYTGTSDDDPDKDVGTRRGGASGNRSGGSNGQSNPVLGDSGRRRPPSSGQ